MEIYDGGHFHPENDLFHGIAEGPRRSTATSNTYSAGSTRSISAGSS